MLQGPQPWQPDDYFVFFVPKRAVLINVPSENELHIVRAKSYLPAGVFMTEKLMTKQHEWKAGNMKVEAIMMAVVEEVEGRIKSSRDS